ncbi:unnamed protein product [Ambrosiozyma monospora]|uniref:Unnamed protein product n=1 Tax=Ambrosiozyma monospora TaxID=43982 RepID=A0ACB5T2V4_AMBMO|nr:unnamed protein product [Ambrosiozyma monospora]
MEYVLTAASSDVQPFLDLYSQGYLTLDQYSQYDMITEAGMSSEFSSFATQLPWYSSRILPELDDQDESSVPVETESSTSSLSTTSSSHVQKNNAASAYGYKSNILGGIAIGVPALVGLVLL